MPLSVGDKLGPYEIRALIGAGGMGAVYRARDPRLKRDVAIKVSAAQFGERFEREAQAIAALNHSNICQLYDVGPNYLVMELVEGQTLAERIKQGAIPLDEALAVAKQIAAALEAAHEKGITHRDLKPGNINLKPDGTVKVLDFGLAKMGGIPNAQSDNSPTRTIGPTQSGTILGTAAYMSPEQTRGKEVDGRADIWAFGVVLYEMVTGQKLFKGDALSEVLASVIKEEPKLDPAPAKVQRLLRSCLEKDPKQRLQAIGDWRLLLEETTPPLTAASKGAGRLVWPSVAAVLVAALAIALWAPWRSEKPVDRPLLRLDVDLGADVSLPVPIQWGSSVAISPDGTRLAYASGKPVKLFTRRLDQTTATELPGTQGAAIPFFSPDGQWIGFFSGDKLNKVSVEGGAVVPLGDLSRFTGANWGEDGSIFVSADARGLLEFPPLGVRPRQVATLGNGELTLSLPQILPGGKTILFAAVTTGDVNTSTIEALTLADRHRKVLVRGGQSPRYLPTLKAAGHLVYVNKSRLFAIPLDLDKLETNGTAVPVVNDIGYESVLGIGQLDFSSAPSGHGTLVYRKASASEMVMLQWVDSNGTKEPLRHKPGRYDSPSLSLDGKRIALQVQAGDIWAYDLLRDTMTRLTFGGVVYDHPIWSPDGQYVVCASYGKGMFQARSDGAGPAASTLTELKDSKTYQIPWSFTPDGKRLAYYETGIENPQIWTVPLEDQGGQLKAGKPERFLTSGFDEHAPSFSPDGHWLAYASTESGKFEVYVRAFPPPSSGQGSKLQMSNSGGDAPRFSRNGHDLLYQSGDQIMAVSYTLKRDKFVAEKPRVWIAKLGGALVSSSTWDVAPDGKRVIVLTPVEPAEASKQEHEVVFLLNFFDELRRRVPASK